jgi:transcription initiation factor TFIID subunit 7
VTICFSSCSSPHAERISLATEVLENVNPDLSDSEFIERDDPSDMPTPAIGSDMGDAPTPSGDFGEGDGDDEEDEEDEEPEGDIDEDLAAELNMALEEEGEGDDEEEEEEEEESDEDDDDDDDPDATQARRRLNEEIRDLEAAVAKKVNEIAGSVNPLIKVHLGWVLWAARILFHGSL